MKGHGGEKWRQSAHRNLETALLLHKTTQDYRAVYQHAGSAIEHLICAIGVRARGLMDVPRDEHGGHWHDLEFSMRRRELLALLLLDCAKDRLLRDAWLVVKDWASDARYPSTSLSRREAQDMLNGAKRVFGWLLNRYETI